MVISTMTGLSVTALGIPLARANDWRAKFSTLNFGIVSSENEADRIARYKAFVAYIERHLQVPLKMHQATDYACTILGVVGAGGIGLQLADRIRVHYWDEVGFILMLILVTVTDIDWFSKVIRGRLI